jgi:hypothetical protein
MDSEITCEFCGKTFSSKSNLYTHLTKAKYCISKRNITNPIPAVTFKCIHCEKFFTTKQFSEIHKTKCNKKIIKEQSVLEKLEEQKIFFESKLQEQKTLFEIKLQEKDFTITSLKEKNVCIQEQLKIIFESKLQEKDSTITAFKEQISYLQEQLASVALIGASKSSSITTNNNSNNTTNITQILTPFNLDDDDLMAIVKHKFDEKTFLNAQKGVAKLCYEYIIKSEEGKMRLVCTDPSRERFRYMDEKGLIKEDLKARNFIEKIYPPIHLVGQELYEKTIEKCNTIKQKIAKGEDDTDKYLIQIREEAADKAWLEIRMIKSEDTNKTLRKELSISSNV